MTSPPRARRRRDAAGGLTFAMVYLADGGIYGQSPITLEGQLLPFNRSGDRSEMLSGTNLCPRGLDGRRGGW